MQIRGLHRVIYRGARLASRLDAKTSTLEAARRDDLLRRWLRARQGGLTAEAAAEVIGEARATLYRWQKQRTPKSTRPHTVRKAKPDPKLALAVERLRKTYPMWGKDKLAPLLWKQGLGCSVSKVGRILRALVERGVVQPVPQLRKSSKHAPRKHKRNYAVRLPRKLKPEKPGQIVQVDTVHIGLVPGKTIRHFTGYCPVAKWTVAKAYNRATAASATLFLDKLKADLPFKLEGIQVDGGSEFMAEFEAACQAKDIKLYVLPPRMPQLNGGVERCNGAWRYEFYACTDLPGSVDELNPMLDDWQETYNFVRPHGALSGLTPAEYLTRQPAPEGSLSSQRC